MLSPEMKQVVSDFNNTALDYPKDKTIQELFEAQVVTCGSDTALVFGAQQLSYDELNRRANQVARFLRKKSVGPGSIVALMITRSCEMVVGMLGILKAGGAYLPIDSQYPYNRIKYMQQDSQTKVVLTNNAAMQDLQLDGVDVLNLDAEFIYTEDASNVTCRNTPTHLAYVSYTSGSTGKPKGVMVHHQAVVNFIYGIINKIDFAPKKTIGALTSISFDISVLEILLALVKGLKVAIADERQQKMPKLLNDFIIKHDVQMLQMTPSRLELILAHPQYVSCLKQITEILIGGEILPKSLLGKLKTLTNARIYNMYGPTETTIWSTMTELTDCDVITIGKPIANTQIYIIDENNVIQPVNKEGELCIAGDGVTRGYLNNPDLTQTKFVPVPYGKAGNMYKTGDLAKWLPDGNLAFLGRTDQQVKIRGHRIEIPEIESLLLEYKGIKEAAVIVSEQTQTEEMRKYLCAYIVADAEEINILDLRDYLARELPDYMIPASFVQLHQNLPLTPNSKLDRKALQERLLNPTTPDTMVASDAQALSEDNQIASTVLKIVKDNVTHSISEESFSTQISLKNMGIDSITYVKILVAIEKNFCFEFDDEALLMNRFPTLQHLCDYIEQQSLQSPISGQ